MGKLCSKNAQVESKQIDTEPEISLKTFDNKEFDKYYDLQENKYNILRKLNFEDFFYSLVRFSNENATLEDDYTKAATLDYNMKSSSFYTELFTSDLFQSFIENKIFKHKALYETIGKNEKMSTIFKETFLKANNGLGLKLAQYAKEQGNENPDKNTIVTKVHAIAYGILYCCGKNSTKVKTLFKLFQEDGKIKKNNEMLDQFLLALTIIPSYGMVTARNKLSKIEEIGPISNEELTKLINVSELKDCVNLVRIINEYLFESTDSYTYDQFKQKFDSESIKSLNFMLTPKGVRYMLIQNNI